MKKSHVPFSIYFGIFLILFFLISWFSQTSFGIVVDEFGHKIGNQPHSDIFMKMMKVISSSGTLFLGAFTLLLTVFFVWKRKWLDLVFYYFVVVGGIVFNLILKSIVRRPRPEGREFYELFGQQFESFSFPSGHTMRATVLFLVLVYFVFKYFKNVQLQKAAVAFCLFYILIMGFSRIMLNMHFITDVLGAITASFAWLLLCLILFNFIKNKYFVQQKD